MNNLPETNNCILELENGWLTICFNRPEKRNALSKGLLLDIKIALESVESDRSVRGILFRGPGGVFCAGADLSRSKSELGEQHRKVLSQLTKGKSGITEQNKRFLANITLSLIHI